MKSTIQKKIIAFSLITCTVWGFTARQALAIRSSYSLDMAANMAQFRFGQVTKVPIAISIPKKAYAEDILILCKALDDRNSLQEVSQVLIPLYAKVFKDYTLAVHYFESIAKYGTLNYCNEHITQTINITF